MPSRDRSGLPDNVRLELLERELEELRRELEHLGATVDALTVEDKIRAGVRMELRARAPAQAQATANAVRDTGASLRLTLPQKIGGGIAGAILVIDAVRGLVS